MLGLEEYVKELSLSDLEVSLHIEALSGCVALSQTQDAIDFLRNTELLIDEEELERLNTELEVLQTDLVLRVFALNMNDVAVLSEVCLCAGVLEVA